MPGAVVRRGAARALWLVRMLYQTIHGLCVLRGDKAPATRKPDPEPGHLQPRGIGWVRSLRVRAES